MDVSEEPVIERAEVPPALGEVLSYATPDPANSLSTATRLNRVALGLLLVWLPMLALSGTVARPFATYFIWLIVALPMVALIIAVVSLNLPRKRSEDRRRAILAIVLSLICSIVALVGAALPSLNTPRSPSPQVKCGSNLRQIGQGIMMYANDHKGRFPTTLDLLISDQDMSPEVFTCPSTNDVSAKGATTQQIVADFAKPGRCSYIYVGGNLNTTTATAAHIAAYEPLANHKGTGMNVLFGDGHAEWLDVKAANYMLAELAAGRNPPKPAPSQ